MLNPKNKQENGASFATGNGLPTITTDSKFNQGYTVASPVNGGGQATAVCNSSGLVELFTQGTDGSIWNFFPDPGSDTGYSGVSTGLKGSTFNAGTDENGNIVVLASIGLQLSYIVEAPGASPRWSAPTIVEVPQPINPTLISGIFLQSIAGTLYVGVLTAFNGMPAGSYSLAYSVWDAQAPVFNQTSIYYNSLNCIWAGSTAQTASILCIQNTVSAFNITTGQNTQYPMTGTFTSSSATSMLDGNGNNQLFAVLADGNVYQLVTNNSGKSYYWAPLSQGMIFRQVSAALDSNNNLSVFGVSGDNKLYHWLPVTGTQSGFSYPPAAIANNVALMGLAGNDGGAVDLFTIGTAANSLYHIFLEETSMNWSNEQVEVPVGGALQEYVSYSTDITAHDTLGATLVNAPVTIYAAEESLLNINGSVYFVSATRPATLSTNNAGILSICQQTGTLSIPVLEINYTGIMSPSQKITIDPSANVQEKLATTSGTDLMNAKDQSGNPIIGDKYRTVENTDSMAEAFNSTMKVVGTQAHAMAYPNMRHGTKKGIWLRESGSIETMRQLSGNDTTSHWQLSFEGDRVIYKTLDETAVAEVLASKASLPDAFSVFDWIGSIADFLGGVIDGIIDIGSIVVKTMGNAIKVAITFVIDGVSYLYNAVINLVEQAMDLVQMIFAKVKAAFEKVWEWIGFLFSWSDILRTHEAIAYTINQFMGFLSGSMSGMQTIVDNGFTQFKAQITSTFQRAITNIAGQNSIGGYNKANEQQSPQFESATSNNVVLNGMANNGGSSNSNASFMKLEADDPILDVLAQLLQLGVSAEASSAFAQAQTYFQNLGGAPDQIFSCLLAGLLSVIEGIALAIVSGVQAITDAILKLGATLIQVLQATLNEEWNIPIVTPLYAWLTDGAKLTTLDVIALVVAIPVTFTYKIIYNSSPFPDAASVTTFQQTFNTQSMLNAAGFGNGHNLEAAEAKGGIAPQYGLLFAVLGAITGAIGGIFTGINDAYPKEAPKLFSGIVFVLEICTQAALLPWWTNSDAPSCNPSNVPGVTNMLWLIANVGIFLDAVFIYREQRMPENSSDKGVIVQVIYAAIGHLPLAVMASVNADGMAIAANMLPVVPEIAKLLRLEVVQKATDEISVIVLGVIDGVCYVSAAIINFINAVKAQNTVAVEEEQIGILAI